VTLPPLAIVAPLTVPSMINCPPLLTVTLLALPRTNDRTRRCHHQYALGTLTGQHIERPAADTIAIPPPETTAPLTVP